MNGSKFTPAESNGASKVTASEVRTEDFYLNVIYWHPDTWYFEDGKLPVLKWIKWQEEQKK